MLDRRNPKDSKVTPTRDIIIGAVKLQSLKSSAIKVAPQTATKRKTKCERAHGVYSHSPKSRLMHSIGVFSIPWECNWLKIFVMGRSSVIKYWLDERLPKQRIGNCVVPKEKIYTLRGKGFFWGPENFSFMNRAKSFLEVWKYSGQCLIFRLRFLPLQWGGRSWSWTPWCRSGFWPK